MSERRVCDRKGPLLGVECGVDERSFRVRERQMGDVSLTSTCVFYIAQITFFSCSGEENVLRISG